MAKILDYQDQLIEVTQEEYDRVIGTVKKIHKMWRDLPEDSERDEVADLYDEIQSLCDKIEIPLNRKYGYLLRLHWYKELTDSIVISHNTNVYNGTYYECKLYMKLHNLDSFNNSYIISS